MSSLVLKIIACITMLIAHIGAIFMPVIPEYVGDAFYLIGRVAFPIYAFLITEGWLHTRSKVKYIRNLSVFALISQIPFVLAINTDYLNVLFTLSLGAVALWIEDKAYNNEKKCFTPLLFLSVLPVVIPIFFNMDYGWKGVLMIALMGLTHSKKIKAVIIVFMLAVLYLPLDAMIYKTAFLFACLAIIPIMAYNGKPGKVKLKYLFYGFYPAHLLILYCIYRFVC